MNKILFISVLTLVLNNLIAQKSKLTFCSYYGNNARYTTSQICGSLQFTSNADAERVVDKILNQVGLKRNFIVMSCPYIENALALNMPSDLGLLRYIVYDNAFLERVNNSTNTDWAAISILAHEVGHHLNGHTLDGTGSRPNTELEADEFSGFAMYKLGASLSEAQAAMSELQNESGSSTHPPKVERLLAIKKGWNNAKQLSPTSTPSNKPEQQPEKPKTLASKYGKFTDKRDGKVYKTVRIGDNVWLAENADYEVEDSYYIKSAKRLYTWEAALNSVPEGWHLPTKEDFEDLARKFENQVDMLVHGDLALEGGFYSKGSFYTYSGIHGSFWSSYEVDMQNSICLHLTSRVSSSKWSKSEAKSVRWIKD
jgi:Fibrobacter succinogenes major domain (Fib_succ_major)